jgi:hypothetical protein
MINCNLHQTLVISGKMGEAGHVTGVVDMRSEYKTLVQNPAGKIPLHKSRHRLRILNDV